MSGRVGVIAVLSTLLPVMVVAGRAAAALLWSRRAGRVTPCAPAWTSPFHIRGAQRTARPASMLMRRVSGVFIFGLVLLLLAPEAWAAFTGGPSVRVTPNTKIEIRWTANFVGDGKVEIFDNPNGGVPIDVKTSAQCPCGWIEFSVGGVLQADTTYFFRVIHKDPTNVLPDLTNDPAPYPSFFTGLQPPDPEPEQPKLTLPTTGFGRPPSVDIDGDTMVVGAAFDERAAYVFVKPAGDWATTSTFDAKLTNSGGSVAIDGDTVVVSDSGAVNVFVKPAGGWAGNLSETAKLTASDGACLGKVAIDGDTVVVGDECGDTWKGSAYVFRKPAGGWAGVVNETSKLTASDGKPELCNNDSCHPGDRFGRTVAISGNTLLVGAPSNDSRPDPLNLEGAVYVFVEPAGGWAGNLNETAKLIGPPFGGRFGERHLSVAIDGDTAVVGVPSFALVFVEPTGGWAGNLNETAKLTPSDAHFFDLLFDTPVAISGDSVVIGARINDLAKGAAYVFLKPTAGWAGTLTDAVKLRASDGETFDMLGSSVAISGDTVVAAADEWGDFQASVYVFTLTDSTAPTISLTTPPQGAWYGSDVTVDCAASDSGSGLANPSDASFTLSTSVAAGTETSSAVTDSRQVCDLADNCATAGPFTFKIDKKKPVITISVPASGATYTLGQVIAAAYDCDDGTGSGIATCTGSVANGANIDTSAGSHVFTVNGTDNVGNANSASVTYSIGYAFSGFLSPVNNPPTVNTGKAGRTYPIKWQLRDANGNFVSALSAVAAVVMKSTPCDTFTNDPTDALETSATGGTGLSYDSATNQYQYNWAAPGKGCYTLFLKLDSGQVFTAFFQLF